MSSFEVAVQLPLKHEGGYVDNPADSGGATNCGISLRFLKSLPLENLRKYGIFINPDMLSPDDIKNLTLDQVKLIFKGEFWDAANFGDITYPYICSYIFDMCINHGLAQGIKIAQRATWVIDYLDRSRVVDDGVLGDKTIHMINNINPSLYEKVLMSERAGFMRLIAAEHGKDREFLHGWLNRCYRV